MAGGVQAGRLNIEIVAEVARLQADLEKAKRTVRAGATDMQRSVTEKLSDAVRKIGPLIGALGLTAVAASFGKITRDVMKFQDAMAEVSTLVDESRFSMAELTKAARDQAKFFGSSPLEQAKAQYQIISAGATSAAHATELLTASNKLAIGGVTDIKTAADGLTSVLNAYGPAAGSAADVSDALFIAMRAGKTTIGELSASLGKVAPIAASVGVSFDELSAAVSALTKGGIATTEAVTGMRAILAAVAKPADEAVKMADKLGLSFDSSALKSKGFVEFLRDVIAKTGGNTDALAKLFGGVEALIPIMALAGSAGTAFNDIMEQMAVKAGATEAAFDKIANSPGFKWNQLLAVLSDEAMKLGTVLLTVLVPAITFLTSNLGDLIKLTAAAAGGYVAYRAALLATAAAQAVMSGSLGIHIALLATTARTLGVLTAAKIAATAATTAFAVAIRAAISIALGPIGIALSVAAAAYFFLTRRTREAALASDEYRRQQQALGEIQQQVEGVTLQLAAATGQARKEALANARALRQETLEYLANAKAAMVAALAKSRAADASVRADAIALRSSNTNSPLGISRAIDVGRAGAQRQAQADANLRITIENTRNAIAEFTKLDKIIAGASAPVAGLSGNMLDLSDSTGKAGKSAADASAEFKTFLEGLQIELRNVGKTEAEIKALDVAAQAAAADKAGFGSLAASIRDVGAALATATKGQATQEAKDDYEKNILAPLREELELSALVGVAREHRANQLQRERDIAAGVDPAQAGEAFGMRGQKIDDAERIAQQQAQLEEFRQALDDMVASAQTLGTVLSDAFGQAGAGIGRMIEAMTVWGAISEDIANKRAKGMKVERADEEALKRATVARDMAAIAGVKSLFKEKSAAYKAITVIEKVYAALQFANMIKSMVMDTAATGASVANSMTRGAADMAAGASKIFSQLGVFAFPVVAAMVAVLVALGLKGGKKGSSAPSVPTAEEVQAAQGAGTVLGDSTAKSASIANSLEIMSKNSARGLDQGSAMVRHLRAIQDGIEALAANLARSFNVPGGLFDTSSLNIGAKGSSGFLGLFASSTTRTLFDQGVEFSSMLLSDAVARGLQGNTYQVVEQVKKKSGFLGIGGGTKTTYQTTTSGLDAGIEQEIGLILGSIRDSVVEAAKVMGMDVAAALDTFRVEIGKVSFKDLKGDDLTAAIEAVFSKVADQMAGFAVEGLAQYQKVGEGLFETLMRLAKDYLTIDQALKSIGLTFGAVGAGSIAAREALIELSGGLENFVDRINFYYENFLTSAEQQAFMQMQVDAALTGLGLTNVKTIDQFKAVVNGLDLTTEAGAATFATLMEIAPAFYEVTTAAQTLAKQLADQRQQMQVQLLQAQGKTAEALAAQRAMELARLDPSLRALQNEIYAAQDLAKKKDNLLAAYKRESQVLQQTADRFRALGKGLREFRDSLFAAEGGRSSALVTLMKTGALARAGDEGAMGELPGVGRAFLDIARNSASSLEQYQRDVAMVARYAEGAAMTADGQASIAEQQLAQMKSQVGALVDIDEKVQTVAEALAELTVTNATNDETRRDREEERDEREERHRNRLENILGGLLGFSQDGVGIFGRMDRLWSRIERNGAIAVTTDADTPLLTETAP